MASIEEKVEALIKPKVEEIGYELYDVLYLKEGKNYTLRIVIDNSNGISLEDCEKVSNGINDILDEADYIKDQYFLEVSSPGIERVIRKDWQFKKYIGSEVEVSLFKKDNNGFKEYIGFLKQADEEYLKLKQDEKEYKIHRSEIAQVKLIQNINKGERRNESSN